MKTGFWTQQSYIEADDADADDDDIFVIEEGNYSGDHCTGIWVTINKQGIVISTKCY